MMHMTPLPHKKKKKKGEIGKGEEGRVGEKKTTVNITKVNKQLKAMNAALPNADPTLTSNTRSVWPPPEGCTPHFPP